MTQIIKDLHAVESQSFGQSTLSLSHNLVQTGLYSDIALAELLERASRTDYHVSTIDPECAAYGGRREGAIEGLSGLEVLEAVRTGNIWINLRNVTELSVDHKNTMEQIYSELQENLDDFGSFNQQMTILISSPNVEVGYHCDVPGQTLWQIRGAKRIWVYPAADPFLPQASLENIALGRSHEVSLDYSKDFDSRAEQIDLMPGTMLTWAHNAPHRVVNHNCLNVSVTTEHWTSTLRNRHAVNVANGLIRNSLGINSLSQSTNTMSFYPKLGIAAAYKLSGLKKKKRHATKIDFQVDPSSPGGYRNIEPRMLNL